GAFERAQKSWSDGRQRDGARRLLALVAKAGIGAPELAEDPGLQDALEKELGLKVEGAALEFARAAGRFAIERDMKAAKDDSAALDAALAGGFPPGHVLVIAAGKVDGRLPLVKKLAGAGRRVTTAVETEGTWDDQRLVLGPVLESLLAGTGKRVDRAAEARLAELVGDDARTLSQEVAKLAAYVGDRKVIGAEDVDAIVTRVASDPFFALGNAVEARDLPATLGVLDRSIADGASPFMILGSLAGTIRRLLVERERARRAVGDRRLGSAREWEREVLPLVSKEELGTKKPYGFWMKYQASLRFTRDELLDALAGLADADVAMKSGGDGRLALERVLVGLLAPPQHERSST
ncbi:MAG TPA: DNA polymerase III subunit delta, partial [Anaeromyxobacteraceae bacterium]|nr:DNA polymerase III subunit delta [Anaeromyxobacteraceae bacterium]